MKIRTFTSLCIATATTTAFTHASAQTTPETASAVEEVLVTGSRIRGAGGPVGSDVIAIGAEQIQRQPAATITEYLRKVPQLQGFGIDASSSVVQGTGGTNTTRGSALNLRGLGPQATLTLIDGKRLTYSGVSGNYVDPTAIPSIAIERIEVVADGSSAVYGSDAVAGVANFILRKEFDDIQVRGRIGSADDYTLRQYSGIGGTTWDTGSFVFAYEHSEHGNLNGGERSYILSDLRTFGGRDNRNSQCSPGNIVVGGTSYAIPSGGVTAATAGNLVPNTRNLCENLRYGDILPREERDSGYVYLTQDLSDSVSVNLQGLITSRDYVAKAVQQGSTSNIANLTVRSSNPYFVRPVGSTATSLTVEYDFSPELGLIDQNGYTRTKFGTAGLDWNITDDWHVGIEALTTEDRSAQNTRRIDTTVLNARLQDADPTRAFNPFGGGNSQAVLDAIYTGIFNPFATTRTRGGTVQADGSLWDLPGGEMRLAFGAEYLRYTILGGSRQGAAASPAFLLQKQSRNQESAFAELFVPVFGSGNAMRGLQRLDLSAAVRYDDYSDVGDTTNPKFGLNWSPLEGLLLKASYGKSFRAPGLQDLPLLRTGAGLTVVTWTDPLSPTGTSVGLTLNAGNPELEPEKATTYSFTAEYSPDAVPGLQVQATYFSIEYTDVISFPPRTTQSLLDPNYAFAVTRNPSEAEIQAILAQGFPISGVRPPVVAFLYNGSAQNLGSIETRGIDFDTSYRFDTSFGELNFGLNASYLLNYDFAVTQLATPIDQVGFINYPVELRSQAFAAWSMNAISAELTLNYMGSYDNNLVTPVQSVDSWTTLDLHVGYEFENAGGFLSGLAIGLDASNVLDERPPFVNIQGGFDPGQASALGRFISVSVAKTF
jgi:iron complex outermembrane recepter protein